MNNFKVYGLEDISIGAKRGGFSINVQPNGHWVRDAISIYFTRDTLGTGSWSVRVSYSDSYDYKSGLTADEAMDNFIEALQFARKLPDVINPDMLERYFQIGVKEWNDRKKVAA